VYSGQLRVLMLSGWYYPDSIGGTERYVHALARLLLTRGHEVTVAAPSGAEERYFFEGVPVYRYPVSERPSRAEVRGEAPPAYLDVFRVFLDDYRPDIVHMHSVTRGCGFYHALSIKQAGLPLVLTIHVPGVTCVRGTLMRWGSRPCDGLMRVRRCGACLLHQHGLPRPLGWWVASLPPNVSAALARGGGRWGSLVGTSGYLVEWMNRTRRLLDLPDRIVIVAQWLRDVLVRNGVAAHKLLLSRHGLPATPSRLPRRSPPLPGQPLRIGYIGRFDPVKGVHVLVEAVRRLPPSPPIELRLYGVAHGPEAQRYLARLRAAAEGDRRIVFSGELSDEHRWDILADLDILAVPSLCLETGPLVVLEAFAAGLPVVGSKLGGVAELVSDGQNGILLPPGDVYAWARAFQRLASEPHLLTALTAGIPRVRSSLAVVEEMLHLYAGLLDAHKPKSKAFRS